MTQPLVEFRHIHKHFGGVHAVADVSLTLHAGEVVALLGHNGAGKSTLMKTLSGADPADQGEIRIAGQSLRIDNPRSARRAGIETLYQDLALADNLGTSANLFLGRERTTRLGLLDEGAMEAETRQVIRRLNANFGDLRRPVRSLSGGERQVVAIARALLFEARVLIMDEPTAALGPGESQAVVQIIETLRSEGLGIFLVSHDLPEVLQIADRFAVMSKGQLVGIQTREDADPDQLVDWIVRGSR